MNANAINIKKNTKVLGRILIVCVLGFTSCERSSLSELTPELEEVNVVTYENTAKAILDNACVECHNVNEQTAGVRLDAFEFAFIEASSGIMLERMTNTTNPMPPSGNLPDNLIQGIVDWVDDGILEE
ncbi:c-type cytochrome domain-containing protein [uncultured Dokdonia sp.]|uniref:c-type cytochrome domain-containing protein n=1 Tax=uncultured Dokdonia sp. TaxID=575653 RepID=UPI00260EB5A7|nr:c-type cytochrome domain-containing protein [uncultured Dokdonia sp.]